MAPEVGLEPTTRRLTAACSTIELLGSGVGVLALGQQPLVMPIELLEILPGHHILNRFFPCLCIQVLLANSLSTHAILSLLAAGPGFEPGLEDPKSSVLPLHNPASS